MASDTDIALARLHLDLAFALYAQREALGLPVEALAAGVGLSAERIIAIEEGDTASLTDVARLCQALGAELRLDAGFGFQLIPLRGTGVRWIKGPSESEAKTTGLAHSPIEAPQTTWAALDWTTTVGPKSLVNASH